MASPAAGSMSPARRKSSGLKRRPALTPDYWKPFAGIALPGLNCYLRSSGVACLPPFRFMVFLEKFDLPALLQVGWHMIFLGAHNVLNWRTAVNLETKPRTVHDAQSDNRAQIPSARLPISR